MTLSLNPPNLTIFSRRYISGLLQKTIPISSSCDSHLDINYNTFSLPKVSFSPESGGSVKPRRAIEDIRTQGTIRLKK